jgi:hypothetical protein
MKYSFKIPEKYRKYLPSKEFTKMIGVWALVFCVLFLIFFIFSKKESFNSKKGVDGLEVENQTIIGLINTDTDGDGLLDWEEALWGTDKNKKVTFNGIPDNIYVKNKKKELDIEQEKNDLTLTETERFAREFFSAYTALKASGEVDDQSINAFSDALGQRIANPTLIDKYKDTETTIQIQERLYKELETDVALRIENGPNTDWIVSGRGELHLAILIERMRREGYEFQVSRPQVITKVVDGVTVAPYERLFIETPEEFSGTIIQKLGQRHATLINMKNEGGIVDIEYVIPTRELFGFRSQFITDTKGLGLMNTIFEDFRRSKIERLQSWCISLLCAQSTG